MKWHHTHLFYLKGCRGGDACCTVGEPCYESEGDCDIDEDCMPGLRCGYNENFCRIKDGGRWEDGDDCCYKPGKWKIYSVKWYLKWYESNS